MKIAESMAMELEQESQNTRIILEAIPEESFGWNPHEKSMTFGQLGSHLAECLTWMHPTLDMDEFAMDVDNYQPFSADSSAGLLAAFDKNLAGAVQALRGVPDESMMGVWKMIIAGKTVIEMPRMMVIRGMMINHAIHHRAQLGVYLRINNIPVPKCYGPTADFPEF